MLDRLGAGDVGNISIGSLVRKLGREAQSVREEALELSQDAADASKNASSFGEDGKDAAIRGEEGRFERLMGSSPYAPKLIKAVDGWVTETVDDFAESSCGGEWCGPEGWDGIIVSYR